MVVFVQVLTRSPVSLLDFFCSLPRNQSRDVTPRLGVSVILQCFPFTFMQFISGYSYYDYVVIGGLRRSWFTEILFLIGILLSKEVKQLKIIIIIIIIIIIFRLQFYFFPHSLISACRLTLRLLPSLILAVPILQCWELHSFMNCSFR